MKRAFTLIELLVVIAILAILLIMGFGSWRNQINKARDADRKSDLQRLSVAFEDYFNDYECYPPAAWFDAVDDCGSDNLSPYLDKIPCDPVTKLPYFIEHTSCVSYRILTTLDNDSDPVINSLNCQPNCGYSPADNYGIASSNLPVSSNPVAAPSPSPSPAIIEYYACDTADASCSFRGTNEPTNCGSYYWPNSCPVDCANPIYQCPQL
ncbi:MAG: type II secretion system protein [Patescibacteria group bacterium]